MTEDSHKDILASVTNSIAKGFSIIPCQQDKKPYVPWTCYQKRQATEEEIRNWWDKWPDAMIGIVTGAVSGIVVIDVDTEEGLREIQEYLPDSTLIPTCTTPRGGQHLYFAAPETPLPNNTRLIPGCDFRGEGGYVIAPPSINGSGKPYRWIDGLSITEVEPPPLPQAYIEYINNRGNKNSLKSADSNGQIFCQGRRDEDLFHVAYTLLKGGMSADECLQYAEYIAEKCNPPFSKREARLKVESASKRLKRGETSLAQEIREFVLSTNGVFSSTDVYQCLHLSTRSEKKNVSITLRRMREEGVIESCGTRNGFFRRIERDCETIDFLSATDDCFDIQWPFAIEKYVITLPGNIIVIAGEPNSGKTAFLLNLVKLNMSRHKVHYFSSEMAGMELRARLKKFGMPLQAWDFSAWERSSNFGDVVHPDGLNIIDFLEIYEDFYKVGGLIREIHEKLNRGIAAIAIQKNRDTDFGLGGMRSLEKPRLYLAMGGNKLRIVKAKNWAGSFNPNNLEIDFKLVDGCTFLPEGDWKQRLK